MYPVIRFFKELWKFRNAPALPVTGTHISTHICWPWDLDPWVELNNGRTLTLYDLGRIPLAKRVGLVGHLREHKWGITVAGTSVRYRRRVRMFDRLTMMSRVIGWDARFFYLEQSMWHHGHCASHMLLRSAITSGQGIVAPVDLLKVIGRDQDSPALPDWVLAWIDAEAMRPWPPSDPPENLSAQST